jgi:hypothetical protein
MSSDLPLDLQKLLAEHRRNTRYFLAPATENAVWQEVTEQEFVNAERGAGFRPKPGCGPVATGAFSAGGQRGTTVALVEHMSKLGRYIDLDGNFHTPEATP